MALDRVEKALAMVDRNGQGLEIGPSFSPMAPKREGFNVHVVDYLNAEELRNKYKDASVDIDGIEEVDCVWRGVRLHELVYSNRCYDWAIASHVIEHLPDIVSSLSGVSRC